jgi:hypothetical protein
MDHADDTAWNVNGRREITHAGKQEQEPELSLLAVQRHKK